MLIFLFIRKAKNNQIRRDCAKAFYTSNNFLYKQFTFRYKYLLISIYIHNNKHCLVFIYSLNGNCNTEI